MLAKLALTSLGLERAAAVRPLEGELLVNFAEALNKPFLSDKWRKGLSCLFNTPRLFIGLCLHGRATSYLKLIKRAGGWRAGEY